MSIADQTQNLLALGVHDLAGLTAADFTGHARRLRDAPGAVLAVHPSLVPPSRLATVMTRNGKPGFVVVDLADLDEFEPIAGIAVPDEPLYLIHDVTRGDEMRNWSPDEALPEIVSAGRSPLTISEGISWLLHEPEILEPNHCFMTIASRLRRGSRLDARTPAIWISGGTGRDGKDNKHAPKVGWCWAGNRHTWLGFAATSGRDS